MTWTRAVMRKKPVRVIGLFVILVLAGALIVGVIRGVFFNSSDVTTDNRPQVGAAEQNPAQNALDQTRDEFGPWTVGHTPIGSEPEPALVMLRDTGSIDTSSWTVLIDPTWTLTKPFEILDVGIVGQTARVMTDNHETYTLSVGQPFIIQKAPTRIYAVTYESNGKVTIITQTTEWAKAHGHKR
jgi:hypothetical protein